MALLPELAADEELVADLLLHSSHQNLLEKRTLWVEQVEPQQVLQKTFHSCCQNWLESLQQEEQVVLYQTHPKMNY